MKVKNILIQLKDVNICSWKLKSPKSFLVQKTAGYTWMSTSFVVLPKCSHLNKHVGKKKRCSVDKSPSFAASTRFSLLKSKILLFTVDQYLTAGEVLGRGLGLWVVNKRDDNYQCSGQSTCLGLAACPLCECVMVSRARAAETFCL